MRWLRRAIAVPAVARKNVRNSFSADPAEGGSYDATLPRTPRLGRGILPPSSSPHSTPVESRHLCPPLQKNSAGAYARVLLLLCTMPLRYQIYVKSGPVGRTALAEADDRSICVQCIASYTIHNVELCRLAANIKATRCVINNLPHCTLAARNCMQ